MEVRPARYVSVLFCLGLFCGLSLAAPPAPVIRQAGFKRPARAKAGELVIFMADHLAAPVQVLFSDGTGPTVPATTSWADPGRGMVLAVVPALAQTGNLKLRANGVDSAPYYFRVESGTFTQGTDNVYGQVLIGSTPLADAAVVLLREDGCRNTEIWDAVTTDAGGNYSLHGPDGAFGIMVMPPLASNVAGAMTGVTLSTTPLGGNIVLDPGTVVTGTLVDAQTSAPIAGAIVSLDGGAHEQVYTDAAGQFSARVEPGDYEVSLQPPPGDVHVFAKQNVTVAAGGPQALGTYGLDAGVSIHGSITRAANGKALPGARVSAWVSGPSPSTWYDAAADGAGNYDLRVPANAAYSLQASFDDTASFADQSGAVTVASGAVLKNWSIGDSALVRGRITAAGAGTGLAQYSINARDTQGFGVAWSQTCQDGSYTLRVAANGPSFVVEVQPTSTSGYAVMTYDGSPSGTPYYCEGTSMAPGGAGNVIQNVDMALPQGVQISGHYYTQASNCTQLMAFNNLSVSGAGQHGCGIGGQDWNVSDGTYHAWGIPPSATVGGLYVCVHPSPYNVAAQCWNMQPWGGGTPLNLLAGASATNIDFCLGDRPTHAVNNLRVTKGGNQLTFSWDGSTDLYHGNYIVRGAQFARPSGGSGTFPGDPNFVALNTTQQTTWQVPSVAVSATFFLVTDSGPGGTEGPAEHYGN